MPDSINHFIAARNLAQEILDEIQHHWHEDGRETARLVEFLEKARAVIVAKRPPPREPWHDSAHDAALDAVHDRLPDRPL